LADELPGSFNPVRETDAEHGERIEANHLARLRMLGDRPISAGLWAACEDAFVTLVAERVVSDGRVES